MMRNIKEIPDLEFALSAWLTCGEDLDVGVGKIGDEDASVLAKASSAIEHKLDKIDSSQQQASGRKCVGRNIEDK